MQSFPASSPLLPEIFALHGKWRANQDAVICENQTLSWAEFVELNQRFANSLLDHGVIPGDKIGIVMSNGIPMLQAMMGAMCAGIASVPINLSVNDDALVNMLSDAQVTALVATKDQCARIEALNSRLPESIRLFVTDQASDVSELKWQLLSDLSEKASAVMPAVQIADDAILNIIYSSGTTGVPKGIVHTQAGRRDWAYDLAIALRYHSSARTLLTIGLYSNISWVAMLTTLLAGGTLVISKSFDALNFLHDIKTQNVTHTAMVPIQFQRVIEQIEAQPELADTSGMQAMMSCGSPLHAELKQRIFKHFDCGIIELYGLTEGVITTIDAEQSEGRWSSVGKPLMGTDILIVGDDDQPVGAGESGELVSRGRITMPGYLNRPQANQDACYVDKDGQMWLRTGDIGYADEEGYLYIVDRKKDMVLSGGQNIYPQDIEAVIVNHASVNDVAVIPAKSKRWGETPIALVVLDESASTDQQADILKWSNERLGKQQRIADVVFIEELPRNPNGKVLKRELRVQYGDREYD